MKINKIYINKFIKKYRKKIKSRNQFLKNIKPLKK